MDGQKQNFKRIQKIEENDWRTEVEISDDHNAYRAQFQNLLLKFQQMWDGQLCWIKEPEQQMKLNSGGKRQTHSARYQVGRPVS